MAEYREVRQEDDGHGHVESFMAVMVVKQETDAPDSSDLLDQPVITRESTETPTGREIKQEQSSDSEYHVTTYCVKAENGQIPEIPIDSLHNQEILSTEPIKLEPWNTSDDGPCEHVYKNEGGKEYLHFGMRQSVNQGPIEVPFPVALYQRRTSPELTRGKEHPDCAKLDGPLTHQRIVSAVPNITSSLVNTGIRVQTSNKPYMCIVCDYRCEQIADFRRHSRQHSVEPNQCQLCCQAFLYKPCLDKHIRVHIDKHNKCLHCDTAHKHCFREHVIQHNDNEPCAHMKNNVSDKSHRCSQWDCSSAVKDHLFQHTRTHTGEKPYKCSQCDHRSTDMNALSKHMKRHTGDKPYKCSECDYSSVDKGNLPRHMLTHTGEKPYKCSLCDFCTALKGNLSRHILKHTEDKPYKCSLCDYSSAQKSCLSRHMRTHTGDKPYKCKPYKCSQCDHRSTDMNALSKHMKRHTGDKPYKCSECDYSSVDKGNLPRHMLTHTGEKPYKCSLCDFCTALKGSLSRHILKHTGDKPYKCSLCDYSAAQKSCISRHMRTHTGEKLYKTKPYKCPRCDYRSALKFNLSRHMLTNAHEIQRPYKCSQCDYRCARRSTLTKHSRKHGGQTT